MASNSSLVKKSLDLTHQLLLEQAIPLGALFLLSTASAMVLEDRLLQLLKTEDSQRWMLQLGMGLSDMSSGIFMLLLLSWGIPKIRQLNEAHYQPHPFQEGEYFSSFMAEYLRMMGNVLLWGLLLIIPGFIRYARLVFVPFITLFTKPYREGKVDAFQLSIDLTKGRMRAIFAALIASTAAQMAFEFLPQLVPDLHSAPFRILFAAGGFYVSSWFYAYLFVLFDQAMEEHNWSA